MKKMALLMACFVFALFLSGCAGLTLVLKPEIHTWSYPVAYPYYVYGYYPYPYSYSYITQTTIVGPTYYTPVVIAPNHHHYYYDHDDRW